MIQFSDFKSSITCSSVDILVLKFKIRIKNKQLIFTQFIFT